MLDCMPKFGKGDWENIKILSDLLCLCVCGMISCIKFCDCSAL